MYYDKQKLIDWAWEQVGYHEGDNNWNKYAKSGPVYGSLIDANVWSPDAYPAGWEAVSK